MSRGSCLVPLLGLPGTEPPEGEEEPVFIREVKYLKEVVVGKDPPLVHVYDVVEHGRRFYRTLSFSSDASLSLASMPPLGVSHVRWKPIGHAWRAGRVSRSLCWRVGG